MTKEMLEIGLKICDFIGVKDLEDYGNIEINGIKYILIEEKDENWEDKGKYQYRKYVVEVLGFENKLYLSQWQSRNGGYYTDWSYEFSKPEIVKKVEETVVVTKYIGIKS